MPTQLDYFANDAKVPESTLTGLFFEAVDRFGTAAAFQRFETPDRLVDISYVQALETARDVASALAVHGIERGDRVAVLSENRPEWALSDYGCLCAGIMVVPVYPTLTPSQVHYILEDSGAKLVFVSNGAQAEKALEAASTCSQHVSVIGYDGATRDGVLSWDEFLDNGAPLAARRTLDEFRAGALSASPHDVATVLYTSGTTGPPKGVMLTHNNIASNVRASGMYLSLRATDHTISFLPLSHILQRMVDYLFFWSGVTIAYPRSLETLVEDLKTVQPTMVVSVPRIYEKIYNGVMDAHGIKKKLIEWATSVADRAADERLAGREPRGLLALKYAIGDKIVFRKVRAAVGGRLRIFVSGGGPLAPALNRFFYSIGLTILEGYGLTETSPVTNVNSEEFFRIGTVGKPIPGTEVRIGADGEIFIRGPQVMKGYYNNPEATAEAIDHEGWFATGDIGEIDSEGYLSITDRKKDMIVTAGGKNVAPQPIENRLKTHPLVEQAVLLGDRRRYCSLLVVPAFGPLEEWAAGRGISWSTREELVGNPQVVSGVQEELFAMLDDLASYEQPKKLALLAEEFTVENGLLTPTLKVKRKEVGVRLEHVIDALYAEEPADAKG